MSDLWMILVLLGVSIVLLVVLFNWWQEKKYRNDVEFRFDQTRADVLEQAAETSVSKRGNDLKALSEDMEGWMSEPRVRGGGVGSSKAVTQKIEPTFSLSTPPGNPQEKTPVATVNTEKPAVLAHAEKIGQQLAANNSLSVQADSPINPQPLNLVQPEPPVSATSLPEDYVPDDLELKAAESVAQPEAVTFSPVLPVSLPLSLPAALHTAMDWVGLIDAPLGVMLAELEKLQAEIRSFPQHTELWIQTDGGLWEDLLNMEKGLFQSHPPALRLACALQLADRGGPVDVETVKRFQKSVETLSRGLGLQVTWQGEYAPEQQAQVIDAFAIEVDKAVEFHLMAIQGVFHATKLRGLAEASGMHLSAQGRFELVNSLGQLEFTLRNFEGKPFSAEMLKTAVLTGVTFQLDIPTTPNSVQVFDHMVEVARTLAHSLNAAMTDVNRKPLGDPQLEKIRQQLKTISATMAAQGILPGSPHALRLFS